MSPPVSTPSTSLDGRHSYPVYLDLRDRRVLVVGAGEVAARKIERLVSAGAAVTVTAPAAVPAIADRDDVRWQGRPYRRGEVAGYRLALACTGIPEVDAQVFADGEASGVWVNAADDIDNCSFILPAVARRGPLSVSVSTQGVSPALASWLRVRFQRELDEGVTELARLMGAARAELRAATGSSEHPGWREALEDGLLDAVRVGDHAWARRRLRAALGLDSVGNSRTVAADASAAADAAGTVAADTEHMQARTLR